MGTSGVFTGVGARVLQTKDQKDWTVLMKKQPLKFLALLQAVLSLLLMLIPLANQTKCMKGM